MKKLFAGLFIAATILSGCSDNENNLPTGGNSIVGGGNSGKNFKITDGKISAEVLNNYLARAVTQAEFLASDGYYNDGEYLTPDDDERMILNIGAKFIGRSLYSWGFENFFNDPNWLGNAKAKIDRMHAQDPDLIFQACLFEVVTTKVNNVAIPSWVFEAFDKPVETRNFDYSKIGVSEGQWGANTSIPNVNNEEMRMFFYFMACRYMEIGIEALHLGQVMLMAQGDQNNDYANWSLLIAKIREAAATKARRGFVLCDAHLPNVAVDGKLLFDFASFPLRAKEITGEPQKAEIKKFHLDAIYGRTVGGITPSGWSCARSPYVVEFDNYGISNHPGTANVTDHFVWGYDEISWFYQQPEVYRNEFLWHAVDYLARVDPIGFVQMPGSRVVTLENNGKARYRSNTNGVTCPSGLSQEATIKNIWGN